MKKTVVGLLAHVDAGKTTLSEAILYGAGAIRRLGRVDDRDAFLDTFELERARGITIFSKQAVFSMGDTEVTLMDTPGHVDFSAEMERTLQILDYAVLVINGADGIQGHTETLWRLLKRYQIPAVLFVNKMDQAGTDKERLMAELKDRLDEGCVDFGGWQADGGEWNPGTDERESFAENLAVCDEAVLETYLETGEIGREEIIRMTAGRKLFPVFFGSALKMKGIESFLRGLFEIVRAPEGSSSFGAKIYKISRDSQGNRLTHLKVTGGVLRVKDALIGEEKVNQIRIYSGAKYELSNEVSAGSICAVTGLTTTYPGQGLGIEKESELPVLEPVLNYRVILPENCEVHQMLQKLKELEEEDPQLHIVWDSVLSEIHVMLMGEVQTEILKRLIWERFHVAVEFDTGNIVYKETIASAVEGVGHFEPLRHYAEVHLLLEPGERGSGLQFFTACSEDVLSRNWQRLVLTHLEEKEHKGVLAGASLTDVQITLITGRAHLKHTEGGDFRQATYRAVRQGLKKAKSILLEPYYEFRLEVPAEMIGRAMSDVQKMQGKFNPPETDGDMAVLTGMAAVSSMRDYQKEVISYTGGRGRLFCNLKGYAPCRNQEELVMASGYDSERDLENPTGSVFCAHGAGFVVPWDQVENYKHLDCGADAEKLAQDTENWYEIPEQETSTESFTGMPAGGQNRTGSGKGRKGQKGFSYSGSYEEEQELQAIFERTFGAVKKERFTPSRTVGRTSESTVRYRAGKPRREEYLLVDGYNIIFAWEELRELAKENIHAACDKLMDILSNYQGYRKCTLILVFDAYKVEGHAEEVIPYHNIFVVYTKEAETADQYIEKTVHRIGRQYQVTVATSDGLEQVIIMGQGAHRISAMGLKKEIEDAEKAGKQEWKARRQSSKTYLFDQVSEELSARLEKVRMGQEEL